jgi:hypothetical protein
MPGCSHGNCGVLGRRPPRTWAAAGTRAAELAVAQPPVLPREPPSLPPPTHPPTPGPRELALRPPHGPGSFSLTRLRCPCYSSAPPLGPSLTGPGARGLPGSQRRQALRSTISVSSAAAAAAAAMVAPAAQNAN